MTREKIDRAAQAVEELLTFGSTASRRSVNRSKLAQAIAELAANGEPTERQVDALGAKYTVVASRGVEKDPHTSSLDVVTTTERRVETISREELYRALKGAHYPADRNELSKIARKNKASPKVRRGISNLQKEKFRNSGEVSRDILGEESSNRPRARGKK